MTPQLSRREFLGCTTASTLIALGGTRAAGAGTSKIPGEWTIGCFNRPWSPWTYDDALRGMRAAGYKLTGYLGDHQGESFIAPGTGDDYLHGLKQRIAAQGMSMNVAWLKTNHSLALDETIRAARLQVDNAAVLGVRFLLTAGTNQPDQYQHFYHVMADVAAYAQQRNIQIVLKPHGGISASADEILRCLDRVDQANFRVWYDAGNIIHYTGKDPVADVQRVAAHVTGFCAKDCAKRSGDVMIQFGSGAVDFRGVFTTLKDAGFDGPVMVECCAGKTQQEVTANAQANRQFLQQLFATL